MNTLSWLEILLFAVVFVGTCCYWFGHSMGLLQAQKDVVGRLAAMRRHPSNHLRSVPTGE